MTIRSAETGTAQTIPMFKDLPQDNLIIFERSIFNFNLERLMKKHSLGLSELSRKVGISDSTLHDWISGKVRHPIAGPDLKMLALFLGVGVDDLVFKEGLT